MPRRPRLCSWSRVGWVNKVFSPSVVVARAADVGMEDGQAFVAVVSGAADGLAVEPVVEDRPDRAVGARADLEGAQACGLQAPRSEGLGQAHDAEASAEALLGM